MTTLDFAVIALYAVGMVAVGKYYARQIRTADDYLLGGRSMSPVLIGLSLFATLTSTLTYLAMPGEMIKNGPVIFAQYLSYPIVMVIVGWVLIPRIMRQHVTSGYELLEARLGLTGRLLGAGMFVLLRLFWMATILYATAQTVLIPLLGLEEWWWMPVIAAAMGLLTLIYTVEGGLKAVVMTDAVQALLMFFGAFATIVLISVELGGVSAWWPREWPTHWAEAHWLPHEGASRSLMAAFVAMMVWMVCTAGSDQMAIQRYLATRDTKSARRSFGIQLASNVLSGVLLGLAGLAVLGYFLARPEEMKAGWNLATDADKLMPYFVVIGMPPGMTGLVIAAILSAAMSSLSSGMNSSSAVIVSDFLGRAAGRSMSSSEEVRLARAASVVVGVLAVGLSLTVGGLEGNLLDLCFKVVNLLTAPIFVLFFLALFVPRATPASAVLATAASVSAAAAVAFGWQSRWLLWSPPAGLLAGVVVGVLVSAMPGRSRHASRATERG